MGRYIWIKYENYVYYAVDFLYFLKIELGFFTVSCFWGVIEGHVAHDWYFI